MSYVKIPVFHFYEKMNEGQLKMARFRHIVIFIKSLKALELVSSLQHWVKNMTQMLAGLILESKGMHVIF